MRGFGKLAGEADGVFIGHGGLHGEDAGDSAVEEGFREGSGRAVVDSAMAGTEEDHGQGALGALMWREELFGGNAHGLAIFVLEFEQSAESVTGDVEDVVGIGLEGFADFLGMAYVEDADLAVLSAAGGVNAVEDVLELAFLVEGGRFGFAFIGAPPATRILRGPGSGARVGAESPAGRRSMITRGCVARSLPEGRSKASNGRARSSGVPASTQTSILRPTGQTSMSCSRAAAASAGRQKAARAWPRSLSWLSKAVRSRSMTGLRREPSSKILQLRPRGSPEVVRIISKAGCLYSTQRSFFDPLPTMKRPNPPGEPRCAS